MKRLIDKKTINYVRDVRDRTCLYGFYQHSRECNGGLEVHHIQKRSQLGDDVPGNLITLCHKHHSDAEQRLIDPSIFQGIVDKIEEKRLRYANGRG